MQGRALRLERVWYTRQSSDGRLQESPLQGTSRETRVRFVLFQERERDQMLRDRGRFSLVGQQLGNQPGQRGAFEQETSSHLDQQAGEVPSVHGI